MSGSSEDLGTHAEIFAPVGVGLQYCTIAILLADVSSLTLGFRRPEIMSLDEVGKGASFRTSGPALADGITAGDPQRQCASDTAYIVLNLFSCGVSVNTRL